MKKITPLFMAGSLLIAVCCNTACGGKKKTGEDAASKPETATAAPAAAMKPLDLSSHGIPLTITAPEGAAVSREEGTGVIAVVKDRFNVVISEDKYGDENATAEQAKETLLQEDNQSLNDPDMGMKMEVLKNDPTGYLYMTTNKQGGKICRFTYVIAKDGKKYVAKENFMELNDIDKSMETGYSISREEAEAMYNAVKQ